MNKAGGLFVVMADIPSELEQEFNHWANTIHIPERMSVPGILSARRYAMVHGEPRLERKYIHVYELESPAVIESPEYQRLQSQRTEQDKRMADSLQNRFRNVYRLVWPPIDELPPWPRESQAMMVVIADPTPQLDEEYSAWYLTEHVHRFLQVPGFLRAQRFQVEGSGYKYLTMYDLTDPSVFMSDGFKWAGDTPWTQRMRSFDPRKLRNVYQLLQAWG